ncbi:citrate (Si)-synthase [candidate division KSB1 bacterium]
MATLKEKLASQIPGLREERKKLLTESGDVVISECTVKQAFGGMRGVKGMICDTSVVEPDKGLIIREYPLAEVENRWPEEIFYLLCTGELPEKSDVEGLRKEFAERSEVPGYVLDVLRAMPKDSHPMAMLDTGILVMQRESEFYKSYQAGMHKTEYWAPILEDSLRLLAVLPGIAAAVYRIRFNKGKLIPSDKNLDWGANYAHMLGIDDPDGRFAKLMRLYLTLHCDHEGGNVSANTCHTVGSALSDPFYAVSAGLNGLAGPLHGLANQECLNFVLTIVDKYNGTPTKEQLTEFAWETLNSGKVIPGYGHAVLRVTDPRFAAFLKFGQENCGDDPVFKTVELMFNTIPDVLKEHGKAANPWPNVDAGSGGLLYHFGMTEFSYYTVLFSVSRAMGMCSQLIVNRALGTAITRPKSVSMKWIKDFVGKA